MRWKLFNIATILSLLLCICCLALLARAKHSHDYVTWATRDGKFVEIEMLDGCVSLNFVHSDMDRTVEWQVVSPYAAPYPAAVVYGHTTYRSRDVLFANIQTSDHGAVFWQRGERSDLHPIIRIIWHWGMPAMFAALLPATWLVARTWIAIKRASRQKGHCPTCGYDLRATPDICPECGSLAPQPHA